MKPNKFGLLIKHDTVCGIISKWKYFIVAFIFFAFTSLIFAIHANSFLQESNSSETLGFFDFIFNIFARDMPFDIKNGAGMKLSIVWFAFHSYLLFLTGFYVTEDLKCSASSFILRVKSKTKWWAGKFIWCILSVLVYYLLILVCICLFVVFGKYLKFANPTICNEFFKINISGISQYSITAVSLLLPLIISLAVSSFHMMLSLIIKPIYSFLIGICFIIASAFYCHPLLIFNFTIAGRNAVFCFGSSISLTRGVISALCLLLFSFFAGIVIIRRKDII